jgi:hypothetical protein
MTTPWARVPRFLLVACLAALSPVGASALSVAPPERGAELVPVRFPPDALPPARMAEDDVALQIASQNARLRGLALLPPRPRAAPVRRQGAPNELAILLLLGCATMLVLLRAHQRTSQARAAGPRPTGED